MAQPITRLTRWLSWHRRPVAAGAAALAVFSMTMALRPPEPAQTPVVVTRADLPGGHRLTAADLQPAQWPVELAPAASLPDPEPLVGRTLTAPLSAGSPVTQVSVVSEDSAAAALGMVIAPVRLSDAELVSLLQPGERVDLIGVDETGTTTVIAEGARLVSVPAPTGSGGGLGPSTADSSLILVEVPEATAVSLTTAANSGPLSAVLR
ncbi:Flp pilus assembly protein CpaB [Naumannella halotolerans]|uniref:Flp pilus assembly protein CpaB n=1 Tax=Naumannella halotolerans TaxID=993414 RepID=A0A4R7J5H7_9ACTN|nr:Flp pilus assembly protein CpaB [Naumannella halotolerans]TDT32464.1 Flp pilus assembly protein CpaB [Naumannella halotolerans]